MKWKFAAFMLAVGALWAAQAGWPSRAMGETGGNDAGTWAFEYPKDALTKPGAALDLRSMNEKIAGETGFVRLSSDGNSLVHGDGSPIRFWAVGGMYLNPDTELETQAKFLAKMGVNMVRLHAQIAPEQAGEDINSVNRKEVDGLWRAVAAFKKEGIYVTISPYWATAKHAEKWGITGYEGNNDLWGLLIFNEKLQDGYKHWVKYLYTTPNPHTGIPLAKDPAVAIIQVQNEDSLFFWTSQGIKPEQQELLGKKFGDWAAKKYGTLEKADAAWNGFKLEKDNLSSGVLELMIVWEMTQPQSGGKAVRLRDQTEFFAQTQRGFYQMMADYYRKDLGCGQLINACNWITADAVKLNDLERWTYMATDIQAVNKYFGGVHQGPNNGWRIEPGHFFTNDSALLDYRALPTNLKQVAGHPMIITESSWVNPDLYQAEGPFLIAAYQSLTGEDIFYWFAVSKPEFEMDPIFPWAMVQGQHPIYKWSCSVPEIMGNFPAAAILFRNNYVKQGAPVVHEERSLADMFERKVPRIAEDVSFDPNRYEGKTGTQQSQVEKGIDPRALLVGPVEVVYGKDPAKTRVSDLTPFINAAQKTISSETGEIHLDYGTGVCTIDASKAQGVCGFLKKAGGKFKTNDLAIESDNDYAAVLAVAMDDQPLRVSKRILLQVGTTERLTGWKSEPAAETVGKKVISGEKILAVGQPPWRIVVTHATISITNPGLKKATVLDTGGFPARDAITERAGAALKITMPPDAMWVIVE